jgi:hypothetical protein
VSIDGGEGGGATGASACHLDVDFNELFNTIGHVDKVCIFFVFPCIFLAWISMSCITPLDTSTGPACVCVCVCLSVFVNMYV